MKTCVQYMIVLLVAMVGLFSVVAPIGAQEEAYKLVYIYPNQGTSGLSSIEMRDPISGSVLWSYPASSYHDTYLSPDFSSLLFIDEMGDIVVINGSGEVTTRFPATRFPREQWYLWGWKGNDTLVLAHLAEQPTALYQLDIYQDDAQIQRMDTVSDFFRWDILELEASGRRNSFVALDLFSFSPDFDYVLTPLQIADAEVPNLDETRAYLWRLTFTPTEISFVVEGIYPWWTTGLQMGDPVWSHAQDQVAYATFTEDGCVEIWAVSRQLEPQVVDQLPCAAPSGFSGIYDFAWSSDDTHLAYWIQPDWPERTHPSTLVVANVSTHERDILLEGYIQPTGTVWHPSDDRIAFSGVQRVGDEYVEFIGLVDTTPGSLGSIFMINDTNGQIRLLGWMR